MRFSLELVQLPERIGSRVDDIYWYEMKYDGTVEFYSNSIDVTYALEERLDIAEKHGVLKRLRPGIGSGLRFYRRIFGGRNVSIVLRHQGSQLSVDGDCRYWV